MIEIVQDDNCARVACFCDVCDREITDANEGMYRWRVDGDPYEYTKGSRSKPIFLHKGACAESTARRSSPEQRGVIAPWMELRVFPIYLGENLEIDWERAKKTAAMSCEV